MSPARTLLIRSIRMTSLPKWAVGRVGKLAAFAPTPSRRTASCSFLRLRVSKSDRPTPTNSQYRI